MRIIGFARGRRFTAALGVLLFAVIFLITLLYTLPGETLFSPVRSYLAQRGVDITCADARIVFPLGLQCRNAVIATRGGNAITLESAAAAWEWTGLFNWLPFHFQATRGEASIDVRTSPLVSNPGKVLLRLSNIGSEGISALFSAPSGAGFLIDTAQLQWKRDSAGSVSGTGEGSLSWLRLPIPAQDSPVREALLRDVRLKFVVRDGTVHISSLTGTYEGSAVDGTGEIARILTPAASSITFHLRIQNPMEGKIATLFDLVAKNIKNANLRIKGTLLSPTGEFQFF